MIILISNKLCIIIIIVIVMLIIVMIIIIIITTTLIIIINIIVSINISMLIMFEEPNAAGRLEGRVAVLDEEVPPDLVPLPPPAQHSNNNNTNNTATTTTTTTTTTTMIIIVMVIAVGIEIMIICQAPSDMANPRSRNPHDREPRVEKRGDFPFTKGKSAPGNQEAPRIEPSFFPPSLTSRIRCTDALGTPLAAATAATRGAMLLIARCLIVSTSRSRERMCGSKDISCDVVSTRC